MQPKVSLVGCEGYEQSEVDSAVTEAVNLLGGIKKYAKNCFIPHADLLNSTWLTHLDELMKTDYTWPPIQTNGSKIAAEKILKVV